MALKPVSTRRNDWAAMVTRLSIDPRFSRLLTERNADGVPVVLAVLGEDRVVDVTQRVIRAGGRATLAVLEQFPEGGSRISIASISSSGAAGDHHVPMTGECSVADLLRVLTPGTSITYRMPGDLDLDVEGVQQIDDGSSLEPACG